jgi:hypothetical protein
MIIKSTKKHIKNAAMIEEMICKLLSVGATKIDIEKIKKESCTTPIDNTKYFLYLSEKKYQSLLRG